MREFSESARAEVAQLMLLQVPPDVLRRVEFGCIGGQVLELDRTFETFDVVAHELTAVSGQAVPDHQNLASDLPTQRVKKFNQLLSLDRPRIESEVEALKGDASDRRQLVPIEMILQDRGVATGCPTTNRVGLSLSPDSSMKTMVRPCFLAFFLTLASARASSAGSLPRRARVHDWSAAGC